MNREEVAVIGAGPSGMMAAHAVAQLGFSPIIIDRDPDRTRRNSGVYILHSDCDLLLEPRTMRQAVLGIDGYDSLPLIEQAYRDKVYGELAQAEMQTSVLSAINEPELEIYNAGQAVDTLWHLYGHSVRQQKIRGLGDFSELRQKHGRVVSTIPLSQLIEGNYRYASVWVDVQEAPLDESFMYYNVGPAIPWYRCSANFGVFTAEYSDYELAEKHAKGDVKLVRKVVDRTLSIDLEKFRDIIFTGRYGRWDKSFLTDTVYQHVKQEARSLWL